MRRESWGRRWLTVTILLSASLLTESCGMVFSEYPRSLICQSSSPAGKRKTLKPRPFMVLRMSSSSFFISTFVFSSRTVSCDSVFWSKSARLDFAESQTDTAAATARVARMKLNFRCLISARSMVGLVGGLEMSRAESRRRRVFQEDFFRRRTEPMMRASGMAIQRRLGRVMR